MSWFNANEGTIYWEGNVSEGGGTQTLYFFGDSDNNRIAQYYVGASQRVINRIIDDGVAFNPGDITNVSAGSIKVALTYKLGEVLASVNGSAPVSSSPTSLPSVSQLLLGSNSAGAFYLNNSIESFRYIPRALTATELQELTAL